LIGTREESLLPLKDYQNSIKVIVGKNNISTGRRGGGWDLVLACAQNQGDVRGKRLRILGRLGGSTWVWVGTRQNRDCPFHKRSRGGRFENPSLGLSTSRI